MRELIILLVILLVGCSEDSPTNPNVDMGSPDATDLAQDQAPDLSPDLPQSDADMTPDQGPLVQPEHVRELKAAASGQLLAGIGRIALDPPVGISQGGYGGRTGPTSSPWAGNFKASIGTHGALWVKALALQVEDETLVLVKIPLVFSDDTLTAETTRILKEDHNLDLEGRIIFGATHTHHGPARFWRIPKELGFAGIDTYDQEVISILSRRFASAIATAVDDLEPAEFGYEELEDWDPEDRVYSDRRSVNNDLWGKDPRLSVLAVRRDGLPYAVLTNFGMHGTILGTSNSLLSDDSAGGWEEVLEQKLFQKYGFHVTGMFMQAGGGDAAPRGGHLGHQDEQRMRMVGELGAPVAISALDDMTFESNTELAVRTRLISLRHQFIYGESGEFSKNEEDIYEFGTLNCSIDPENGKSQEGETKRCIDLAPLFTSLDQPTPHHEINQTFLSVARIGPLFLMSLPGESTHSIVDYARKSVAEIAPENRLMVIGYSQDHFLYLTHPDDWYRGEYEAEFSIWGPWGGKYFVDRQIELVEDMLDGFNGPTYYQEIPNLQGPVDFSKRPTERSLNPGTVLQNPVSTLNRQEVLKFRVAGGDPALGTPKFTIEKEHPTIEEAFIPMADPAGLEASALGSHTLATTTLYVPVPATTSEILPEREHGWEFSWQVPADWPTGNYRIVARGRALTDVPGTWTAPSAMFSVVNPSTANLDVSTGTNALNIALTYPPVNYSSDAGAPQSGWWEFDPQGQATERVRWRAPLQVAIDGHPELSGVLNFDAQTGFHVLTTTGQNLSGKTIRVGHPDDRIPAEITATIP